TFWDANPYVYVANLPTLFVDPSGVELVIATAAGATILPLVTVVAIVLAVTCAAAIVASCGQQASWSHGLAMAEARGCASENIACRGRRYRKVKGIPLFGSLAPAAECERRYLQRFENQIAADFLDCALRFCGVFRSSASRFDCEPNPCEKDLCCFD